MRGTACKHDTANAAGFDVYRHDLVLHEDRARAGGRMTKAVQHLSRCGIAVLRAEHAKDDVVEHQVGHERANLVARQHLHARAGAPLELVPFGERRCGGRIGQKQVAALAKPCARGAAADRESAIERLPQLDAVLHHLHGDRRAELLADPAHRPMRRGTLIRRIALDDDHPAAEAAVEQMPGRARTHDRSADDDDVGG